MPIRANAHYSDRGWNRVEIRFGFGRTRLIGVKRVTKAALGNDVLWSLRIILELAA